MKKIILNIFLLLVILFPLKTFAYPEFYEYSRKVSGRNINCALCHANGNGPEGNEPGQIGALTEKEKIDLMKARAAFAPGQKVNSPILNQFGNEIIHILGKKKVIELKIHPENLAKEIGYKLDIDNDGIPDAEEYLDGTLPISKEDGKPTKLFLANFKKNINHIFLAFVSITFLFVGFIYWLKGIHSRALVEELYKKENEDV